MSFLIPWSRHCTGYLEKATRIRQSEQLLLLPAVQQIQSLLSSGKVKPDVQHRQTNLMVKRGSWFCLNAWSQIERQVTELLTLNFVNEFAVAVIQKVKFIFSLGDDLKSILNMVEEFN